MNLTNAIVHRATRLAARYQNALLQLPKNADGAAGRPSDASVGAAGSAEVRVPIGRNAVDVDAPIAASCCRSKLAPAAGADARPGRDSEAVGARSALRRAAAGGSTGRSCPGSRAVECTAAAAGAPATCGFSSNT